MAQWDAFISYARSASTLEAQRLQTAIQTFAKPWYRLRAVRIFRDDSSMSANPALWSSIEQGLQQARWLVVLLSQAAAGSEYVAAEIQWWLRHKDASTILLVHDDGTLAWDRQRNDFSAATDCVPAPLRGAFREEPRWTDLSWFDAPGSSGPADPRFAEKVADLAATIRGIPRDELLGEDVSQHKRSWRLAKFAIGALSLLLIASVVASIIAIAQRNQVQRQATALLARQLAATADSLLARDLRRAQLLAVQAYRTDANAETHAALLRATLASPALRRVVPMPAAISALSASADGTFVVAGLVNGEVHTWNVSTAAAVRRLTLPQRVASVAISDDGTVVAATDTTTTQVEVAGRVQTVPTPAGQRPTSLAVPPTGTALVVGTAGEGSLTFVDLAGGAQRSLNSPVRDTFDLQFVGTDRLAIIGVGAAFELRSYPGWQRISRAETSLGPRQIAGRMSADGGYMTGAVGTPNVPIWRVQDTQNTVTRYALAPSSEATALALNHDASRLLLADSNGLHLAPVRATSGPGGYDDPMPTPSTFLGVNTANHRGVLFLGTSSRFVAASDNELSLWDPDAAGRTATLAELPIPNACVACDSPRIGLSPDGSTMAVRDGEAGVVFVRSVPRRAGNLTATTPADLNAGPLAAPVWLDDGSVLLVGQGSQTGTLTGPIPGLPAGVVGWAVGRVETSSRLVTVAVHAGVATVVGADGWIGRLRVSSGELISQTEVATLFDAAVSPDGSLVAVVPDDPGDNGVTVREAVAGATKFRVESPGDRPSRVLFAHGSLWVHYVSGLVERRDAATGALVAQLSGRFSGEKPMSAAGDLLAIPSGTGVALYDARAEVLLNSISFPLAWQSLRRGTAVARDGSVLVNAFEAFPDGDQGFVVATQLEPEALVSTACRTSGSSLTADDWRVLVGGPVPTDLTCR